MYIWDRNKGYILVVRGDNWLENHVVRQICWLSNKFQDKNALDNRHYFCTMSHK